MHKSVHSSSCLCLFLVLIIILAFKIMQIEKTILMDSQETPSFLHIATVICTTKGSTKSRDQAAIMIKSVIISAKIYKVPRITIHVIVENVEHANYLWNKLKEYGHPFDDLEVNLFTYEAGLLIPRKYHPMVFHPHLKCSYAPYFLAKVLTQIDSVVYFSTKTIVLGNVSRYWKILGEMKEDQMIGISFDNEAQCPYTSPYFKDIPYNNATRLTSGLMVMNLTRMRNYQWEEKFRRIFTDYSLLLNEKLNDQQVLNIFMYYGSGVFKLLPCLYNFWSIYCTLSNMCCSDVKRDPGGIVALAGVFDSANDFSEIYNIYESINLMDPNVDLKRDLMKPIRAIYDSSSKQKRTRIASKCDGQLNKYLFTNHFSKH